MKNFKTLKGIGVRADIVPTVRFQLEKGRTRPADNQGKIQHA